MRLMTSCSFVILGGYSCRQLKGPKRSTEEYNSGDSLFGFKDFDSLPSSANWIEKGGWHGSMN